MDVLIIGAGEIGSSIAKKLSNEKQDVTIIDTNGDKLDYLKEMADLNTIQGDGTDIEVLKQAGVEKASLIIAVTEKDEINIIVSLLSYLHGKRDATRIARIRDKKLCQDEKLLKSCGITLAINPDLLTAQRIFYLLNYAEAVDIMEYGEGKITIIGVKVSEDHKIVGKNLAEIKSEVKIPMLISAIKREADLIIPRGDSVLQPKDIIYIIAETKKIDNLLNELAFKVSKLKSVTISGFSECGTYISQNFASKGISTKIISSSREACEHLASILENVTVVCGDPTDPDMLKEENIDATDAFIAADKDEHQNILAALLAKQMGVKRSCCIIDKHKDVPVLEKIGIDIVISPYMVAASNIIQFVRRGKILKTDIFGDEQAEAIFFAPRPGSSIVNKPLKELELPKESLIGAIFRNGDVIIPDGNSIIRATDSVLLITLASKVSALEKKLSD